MKHEPTCFVLLDYGQAGKAWYETNVGYSRPELMIDMINGDFDYVDIAEIREFDGDQTFRDISAEIAAQVAKYETEVGAPLPRNIRRFCEAHGALQDARYG